ncbi:AcrR family transcriptional regulator [Motilibacter peucedani]|uniref:AcrR family transcriptional regulator n=1 Tax=Motilibacter peucedani TaxID=598650 RepID=A0A420XVZ7_9ACTN|nr:TetR/AcrR family transcriptional regulator [Motilibacter peucedani]RKS84282.1 AcrR family transcriptional regulator [Motilibacter peucedani]
MVRWEPDAKGRLVGAALELFADGGFESTTVAQLADRAGVTERTFFRHFADKREVLFDGSAALQDEVLAAIASAAPDLSAVDVVAGAFRATAPFLERRREFAGQRSAVIAGNPGLLERELLKMTALVEASAGALRERGVPEPAATLAAEAGVLAFRLGFAQWVTDTSRPLADCIAATLADLKVVAAG